MPGMKLTMIASFDPIDSNYILVSVLSSLVSPSFLISLELFSSSCSIILCSSISKRDADAMRARSSPGAGEILVLLNNFPGRESTAFLD